MFLEEAVVQIAWSKDVSFAKGAGNWIQDIQDWDVLSCLGKKNISQKAWLEEDTR